MLEDDFEKEQFQVGYALGEKDGWSKGFSEGFDLGRTEGSKLGQPLGWMLSRLLAVYNSKEGIEGSNLKRLEKIIQEIKEFPLENIEVDREAGLARVKALYKECCCHFAQLEPLPNQQIGRLDF